MTTRELTRVYNFNPGPATLPLPVLRKIQEELLDYDGSGMSVMEMSHRDPKIEAVVKQTEELLKDLLGVPSDYRVLFLHSGASLQFCMVPYNFLGANMVADYAITGRFAESACEEAAKVGSVHIAVTTAGSRHNRIPEPEEIQLSPHPAYLHITSNNTIFGTQWRTFPQFDGVPLIADMSSDILSRRFDVSDFALIYAGAQKNLGPAGVTIVIISPDMLARVPENLPAMMRYDTHAKNNSLYNTPAVFNIYVVNLVLRWVESIGGLPAIEERNRQKAACIYQAIDESGGFYVGHAEKGSRSQMNITFTLGNRDLEPVFVREASAKGLVGLAGHRSVGGMRASIYNAMELDGCEALASFMAEFQRKH